MPIWRQGSFACQLTVIDTKMILMRKKRKASIEHSVVAFELVPRC